MPSPYVSEDWCSHEFYNKVSQLFRIFPIRTNATKIERKEGVDVVYEIQDPRRRNIKAVLVQEKAPLPPPFSFELNKRQHDLLLNRQRIFRRRAYFYAFFCIRNSHQLPYIMGRTVHFDVDKIPSFNSKTRRVKATTTPFYVYLSSRPKRGWRRRGYHFTEILLRVAYCWVGLPKKFFPQLAEDLKRLIEQNERFYMMVYDKDEKEAHVYFNLPRSEREHPPDSPESN